MDKAVEKAYGKVIWVFSFFILLLFVWFSLVSTSTVSLMEKVFFTDISGIPYLIALVISLGISLIPPVNESIVSFGKKLDENKKLFGILYFSLILLILLVSVLWVCLTDFDSWADSADIQKAALGLINGDYTAYLVTGYIGRWQNQIGLALIEAPVIALFGERSPMVFQLINSLCIPIIITSLSRFTSSKLHKLLVLLTGLFWLPLILSASHIYGNVPGLMLSLLSFVYLYECFEKEKLRCGILSAFLIAIACLVKQNYIIFLIAYFLICTVRSVNKKKAVYIAVALSAAVMSILFTKAATGITEHITGFKIEGGVSKWSYIAMGMQEGERAPGWFNEYNTDSYDSAGCNTSFQTENARAEIGKSILSFTEHPSYMISFYTKKLASQWNDPTFQTIWYLRGHGSKLPAPIDYMVSIYGSYKVIPYFKFFEVVIYLSAFLFICFERKIDEKTLLLLTTFIGGVLFHILWEAKAQYALFYFVLLIPVGVNGIGAFRKYAGGLIADKNAKTEMEKKSADETETAEEKKTSDETKTAEEKKTAGRLRTDLVVCFVLFILFLGVLYYLHIPGSLREGTVPYYQYIAENSMQN